MNICFLRLVFSIVLLPVATMNYSKWQCSRVMAAFHRQAHGGRHRRALLRRDPSLSPRLTTSSRRNEEEEEEGREERRSLRTRKEPGPTSRPDNPRGTAVERKSLAVFQVQGLEVVEPPTSIELTLRRNRPVWINGMVSKRFFK